MFCGECGEGAGKWGFGRRTASACVLDVGNGRWSGGSWENVLGEL